MRSLQHAVYARAALALQLAKTAGSNFGFVARHVSILHTVSVSLEIES